MTEEEWLTSRLKPVLMSYLANVTHERKLRLFACACLRRLSNLVSASSIDTTVAILERYADGVATNAERIRAGKTTFSPAAGTNYNVIYLHRDLGYAARRSIHQSAKKLGEYAAGAVGLVDAHKWAERKWEEEGNQLILLRDIFGNPFRPVAVDPQWLTSTVVALAEGIYQERAFDRMPILADALEEAGCDNADILNHCRQPGEHVRGCWVVDLLTGRK